MTQKEQTQALAKSFVLIALIGGIFIVGVSYGMKVLFFSGEPEIREVVEKVIEEKEIILRAPKCERSFEEYEKLVKEGKSLTIATSERSYASGGRLLTKERIIRRNGEIACGYLYVRASRGDKALDEKFDSIYINPHELGGHLIRPRSIVVSEMKENKTEVLFALNNIPYVPNIPYNPEAQNFETTNWVKLFNATQKIRLIMGLSTLSPSGLIEEVRMAYKCWNPETGREVYDCSLSLER